MLICPRPPAVACLEAVLSWAGLLANGRGVRAAEEKCDFLCEVENGTCAGARNADAQSHSMTAASTMAMPEHAESPGDGMLLTPLSSDGMGRATHVIHVTTAKTKGGRYPCC
eukprot:3236644-Rhodomonas_salina.1